MGKEKRFPFKRGEKVYLQGEDRIDDRGEFVGYDNKTGKDIIRVL